MILGKTESAELVGYENLQACLAMDVAEMQIHDVQEEMDILLQTLDQACNLKEYAMLVIALRPWVADNPIMACHLGDTVELLAQTVAEFHNCKADYLDLQVVKALIRNRLLDCKSIFCIEQELLNSIWRLN